MSIIDRARHALKVPHSFAYGGEYAAAVVRAAKLADELEHEADEHPADDDSLDENYRTAARIRQALEGAEE